MTERDGKSISAEQVGLSMQTAAEKAMSDIFIVGFEKGKNRFKNATSSSIESLFTKISAKGSLDDMFEANFER